MADHSLRTSGGIAVKSLSDFRQVFWLQLVSGSKYSYPAYEL